MANQSQVWLAINGLKMANYYLLLTSNPTKNAKYQCKGICTKQYALWNYVAILHFTTQ